MPGNPPTYPDQAFDGRLYEYVTTLDFFTDDELWSNSKTRGFIHDRQIVDENGELVKVKIALVWRQGQLFAVSNTCPHAGADLASGSLEDIEDLQLPSAELSKAREDCGADSLARTRISGSDKEFALVCPVHGWLFDALSGTCISNPSYTLDVFHTHVDTIPEQGSGDESITSDEHKRVWVSRDKVNDGVKGMRRHVKVKVNRM
ncbi:hypothetical protein M427DRAFT_56620 [Gonapodya prolifera JEL478]|uniref:Rieske domain-containing protein n=1 Tax=Gonapodya prolifera (strain JEL478) TaxID=1344416 RepID=A0A139AFD0_GONPJ|nr:hypothetical protein M427DRAFT_56620 [Gonapodya prolifera JEL478]|eukprot:KXS15516.1 hypothetical protein M427DRAFT_56620 [Gonapodya prolifera JEL478]